MKRKFTIEQEEEIVRRYIAGESGESIAKNILSHGPASGENIRNVIRRAGVPLRKAAHESNPVVTDEQKARAVALCESGYTLQQAADKVGISKVTVVRATKAAGVSLPLWPLHRRG